jgi:3-oxoacyl-[acyl-carrier protein] reductase
MDLGLNGKTAIVGGSSKGLGFAIALGLAKEGANVTICARNDDELHQAAEKIKSECRSEILAVIADQTKYEDIKRIVNETVQKFGRIDILVNNTGGPKPGGFFDHEDANWQEAFELLLLYVVRMCREVIPYMKQQGGGRIINNTSFTVKEPSPNLLLSNVFRIGVVSLAKTLSQELAADNILVNNVCPGSYRTARMEQIIQHRAEREGKSISQLESEIVNTIPLGRLQSPEELANLVVFLASNKASAITGATIQVDGGMVKGLF